MKYTPILIAIVSSLLLSACFGSHSLVLPDYEKEEIVFPYIMSDLKIIDSREDTTSRKIKVPVMSLPGDRDMVSPVLSQEQFNIIKEQIPAYFQDEGDEVSVVCEIVEAYKTFSADGAKEREMVLVEMNMKINNNEKHTYTKSSSVVTYENVSFDASQKTLNLMFDHALKAAIYTCFEKLKNE